ncbi:MAG: argininosuccinate lyase [Puniceicoccaceae bacterium]
MKSVDFTVMSKGKQATWGGRFEHGPSERMARFSESVSFDSRLAPFDICTNMGHSAMLAKVGLITEAECIAIHDGLRDIAAEISEGKFVWKPELEDVHMNIEQALTAKVPAAAKLHTGRSRNDQVATDMRLFFKAAACELVGALRGVIEGLRERATRDHGSYLPGYTHLQRAQPIDVAHQWLCYAEMFKRDKMRFEEFSGHANWCPLGSGALAGSTLPLDREYAADQLGFVNADGLPQVTSNSLDAVSDRDLFVEFVNHCALIGLHLSRLAEDMILWSSAEFGFVKLPDAFTTGSSLMPQKKNPDALELIRGKAARLIGAQMTLAALVKAQPLSYNRDLQEDKPPVFDAYDETMACLEILADLLPGITLQRDRCAEAVGDPLLLATDLADYLVERGIPFREAHHQVGALVAMSERTGISIHLLDTNKAREVCPALGEDWQEVFDLKRAMARRERIGMPGPETVRAAIEGL